MTYPDYHTNMTYRYFHTKLSRWRKRFAKIDQEASAILLQRATGRTLGQLMALSRRATELGQSGIDLAAKGMELGIRQTVFHTLFRQLQALDTFCSELEKLAKKLWGDVPPFERYKSAKRFPQFQERCREYGMMIEYLRRLRAQEPASIEPDNLERQA